MTLQDVAKGAGFTITGYICSIFCLPFFVVFCAHPFPSTELRIMTGNQQWSDIEK